MSLFYIYIYIYNIYIYKYIYIYIKHISLNTMTMGHFFKIVILQALQIFNRLLKTKRLLDEKNNNLLKRKMKNL